MARNGHEIKKLSNKKFYIENPIWYEMVMTKNTNYFTLKIPYGTKW